MKIREIQNLLNLQLISKRTPFGRPIQEKGIESIESTLEDEKNYENSAIQCKSCGFVTSILLSMNGCPNCGVEDLQTEIKEIR